MLDTTPLGLQNFTPQLMQPELLLRSPDLLFCTEPDYFTKALEYYTTTYVAPAYYIMAPKYHLRVLHQPTTSRLPSITLLQLLHRVVIIYLF